MSDEKDDIKKHYIYLLREREFIRLNEPTYKIGRTQQNPYDRFSSYPKGTEIILYIMVDDSVSLEKQVINTFKKIYEHKKGYGNEYFSGNVSEMIKTIYSVVFKDEKTTTTKTNNENKKIKEELDLTIEKLKSSEEQLIKAKTQYENFKKSIMNLVSNSDDQLLENKVISLDEKEPEKQKTKKQTQNKKKTIFIESDLVIRLKNMYKYSKDTSSHALISYLITELKNKGIDATQKEVIDEVIKLGGQVFEKKIGDESHFCVGIINPVLFAKQTELKEIGSDNPL
jgi:hypothetical protein